MRLERFLEQIGMNADGSDDLLSGDGDAEEIWSEAEDAVDELKEPILSALRQLAADGDLSRYTLLIGDDTSGRLPARMVWRTFKILLGGHGGPKVTFLPGGRGSLGPSDVRAAGVLSERAPSLRAAVADGRALIVTDNMFTGKTVVWMTSALASVGIACDVVSAFGCVRPRHRGELPAGTLIYSGSTAVEYPMVDGAVTLSGVSKSPRIDVLRGDEARVAACAGRRAADRAAIEIAASLA